MITRAFSKGILIQRILKLPDFRGDEFLGFGDGYVEIEEVKKVGGDRSRGRPPMNPSAGSIDQWKRERLIGVGADFHRARITSLDRPCLDSSAVPLLSLMASKYQELSTALVCC